MTGSPAASAPCISSASANARPSCIPRTTSSPQIPAPFTFTCDLEDGLITRLVGTDTTSAQAERAGVRGKILDWLRANGPASKTAMRKAGIARWEALQPALEALLKEGKIDAGPGRQAGSLLYFVSGAAVHQPADGSPS